MGFDITCQGFHEIRQSHGVTVRMGPFFYPLRGDRGMEQETSTPPLPNPGFSEGTCHSRSLAVYCLLRAFSVPGA